MKEIFVRNELFLENDISKIHKGFRRGTIDPLEVAEACISAYREYQEKYFPWVAFDEELLSGQALSARKFIADNGSHRLLEGIPVGIKDIFNTKAFPTQMGSPIWKGFTPGNDARSVYNVTHHGGLTPGKTVTAEFAVHTLNETLNPHDITRTSGTSSSGSAVAVALGMVPVALGTQTAGSIVRPASFSGVYGAKPSFGLIPRTGMLKTTDSLDTIGYFTYWFTDLVRVFEVLRVHGPNYPISYRALKDNARQVKPADRPWKIALVKTHTWRHVSDYAKTAFLEWAKRLSSRDIEVDEVELPEAMARSHDIHAAIYNKSLSYYFRDEYKKSELVSPIMNDLIKSGNEVSIEEYHAALEEQNALCRIMDDFMSNYDVLISVSTAGAAPLRHEIESPDPALMWTMTHLPVISAPLFSSPAGLPFGGQLVARRYNDYLLFKFAEHLHLQGLIPASANPVLCDK